ncbi:MAG: glycine zipper 2TM domain-containing protein [Sphingobium sp.]|nr:glycine zipper 2TM domain-containing protein [Sphingobium sp.]
MNRLLKNGIAALALSAMTLGGVAATPALADRDHGRHGGHDNGRHGGDRYDDDRHDNGRHEGWRDRGRGPDRVVVIHNYDWNRPDPRYRGYYAERYYRGGYAPIVVTRQTRIYRGDDGRYYCRRSDGTTGLIIGALVGGVIGDRLDRGHSSILGAVLGASAGGLIGRELDRGEVVCR